MSGDFDLPTFRGLLMQLKSALLGTAVLAALALMATHSSGGSDTTRTRPQPLTGNGGAGKGPVRSTTRPAALAVATSKIPMLGYASNVGARPGSDLDRASTSADEADASPEADRARGLLESAASDEVHRVAADGFVARDVMVDRDGTEHVRINRTYQGLRVIGGDIVVHSRNGSVTSISQGNDMKTFQRPDLTPGISADEAKVEAGAAFKGAVTSMQADLVVFARGMAPTLAYEVDLRGIRNDSPAPGALFYYIDASNGKLLQEDDRVLSAATSGTARTIGLGNVGIVTDSVSGGFQLLDPSRGGGKTEDNQNVGNVNNMVTTGVPFLDADNVWGNNATSDRATAGA